MAAFQGLIDDLLEFGLRLRPRAGIALAIVSWMIFHVVAAQTTPVAGQSIAQFTAQSLLHFAAFFLEFAVDFNILRQLFQQFVSIPTWLAAVSD